MIFHCSKKNLKLILSEQGQQLVKRDGYVPLPAEVVRIARQLWGWTGHDGFTSATGAMAATASRHQSEVAMGHADNSTFTAAERLREQTQSA